MATVLLLLLSWGSRGDVWRSWPTNQFLVLPSPLHPLFLQYFPGFTSLVRPLASRHLRGQDTLHRKSTCSFVGAVFSGLSRGSYASEWSRWTGCIHRHVEIAASCAPIILHVLRDRLYPQTCGDRCELCSDHPTCSKGQAVSTDMWRSLRVVLRSSYMF
ncbi:hypothetical protein RRG08_014822 [Elysia crispata]|uniref:Secreted protein n=1 Tax=Elysia crispata TaxID=231223 RepID=A0AAE0Z8R9_9GAST|nr:hypothetical protein RRG08_014822 [Elysia crispata]